MSTKKMVLRVSSPKPTDQAEIDQYCRTYGDLYLKDTPPPWAPADKHTWAKSIFGDWFERGDDLPYCCDPSMERYWCM